MLPSNLSLNISSTKGYNNKILISSAGMKISPKIEINKDKLPEPRNVKYDASDKQTIKEHAMAQDDNLRMLTEKRNDE